jgi:hypothetical protein
LRVDRLLGVKQSRATIWHVSTAACRQRLGRKLHAKILPLIRHVSSLGQFLVVERDILFVTVACWCRTRRRCRWRATVTWKRESIHSLVTDNVRNTAEQRNSRVVVGIESFIVYINCHISPAFDTVRCVCVGIIGYHLRFLITAASLVLNRINGSEPR